MTEEFTYSNHRFCGVNDELMRCNIIATATVIAIIAVAASTAIGAYSAVSSAKAQEAASKYNTKVQRNNALTANRQAKYQADRIAKRNRLIAGKQRAGYAKAGIDLSGSAEDVMMDSAIEGELDRQAALYAGATSAQSLEAQAKLSEFEGRTARRAGYVRAGSAILSGVSSGANIYTTANANQDPEF